MSLLWIALMSLGLIALIVMVLSYIVAMIDTFKDCKKKKAIYFGRSCELMDQERYNIFNR